MYVYVVMVETTISDAKFIDGVYKDQFRANDIVDAYKRAGHIAYVIPSFLCE